MAQEVSITDLITDDFQQIIKSHGITIISKDFHRLTHPHFLNDQIIDFYLAMIQERSRRNIPSTSRTPKKLLPSVYAFSSFFYEKLTHHSTESVKTWPKEDIFFHSIIFVPINNIQIKHWSLVAIDTRNKTITYYDSKGYTDQTAVSNVKKYLVSEHERQHQSTLDIDLWKTVTTDDIPKQEDETECGVFLCMYAEDLSREAPFRFTVKDTPNFRARMKYEILKDALL